MTLRRLCVALCISMAGVAAQSQPLAPNDVLDRIESAYSSIEGAAVEVVAVDVPTVRRTRSVDRSGNYLVFDMEEGKRDPTWFSAVDGEFLYEPSPGGYLRHALKDLPEVRIWWVAQLGAPWPLVTGWVGALRAAPDVEIAQSADELTISSEKETLSLTFNTRTLALTALQTSESTRWEFLDFGNNHTPPMPGSYRQIVDLPARGPTAPATTLVSLHTYVTFELNPSDMGERLRTGALIAGLARYDPKTGNMYDADGKKTYNYDAYAKKMIAEANRQASGQAAAPRGIAPTTWLIVAGILGLIVAMVVLIRRSRSLGRAGG